MAAPASLPALLDTLTKSISTTLEAAPKLANFELPKDGISLLDVKNELLLSYLQNLVFLILLKLRQARTGGPKDQEDEQNLDDLVVSKLVELRLYLEKGARPLEDKLKYQIDKVLRAADDAERNTRAAEEVAAALNAESGSEAGSDNEEQEVNDVHARASAAYQARANLSAISRPAGAKYASKEGDKSGVYRPPKISAVSMPTFDKREKKEKPLKSATLDEFIQDEMSSVPMAQPSIGTTIMQGGRKIKTATERAKEDERREYEERNFVRLPKESKKDRAKRGMTEGRRMNYGGEEWRGLSEGLDRISQLTRGKSSGGGTKALLEKSRKRGIDTVDGPRGSGGGADMGERYQKKLKMLEKGRGRNRR
ncbi:Sas10/Utp3/C1D family-domain-containing protein [Apiosordaria backusii]|uniref:Sas10/Utp3/C1D family-domain-containing protein n=1 Tax=Apiosordaria backusii TaxID=314023 RepID=A0AA40DK44_9PEZI|nr:Sas10/Utp3/C1D family-domain-containing protein [Apiosordaria backusii]